MQGVSRRTVLSMAPSAYWVSFFNEHSACAAASVDANDKCDTDEVVVDISDMSPGALKELEVGGVVIAVRRRTEAEIRAAAVASLDDLLDPELDEIRAPDPHWLVVIARCPHAGCPPYPRLGDFGGWFCFCHGSDFDTSGRVRSGPASRNLTALPYELIGKEKMRICLAKAY